MRRFNHSPGWVMCGALMLCLPVNIFAQEGQRSDRSVAPSAREAAAPELPDSPGAVQAQNSPQQQSLAQSSITPITSDSQPQKATSTQQAQEPKPQRPVGTAAAEAPVVSGITAAQPAGVAIAPAKQHRVRTIVLRTGAILGAGVALGTTIALTAGTSSKPPGAH